MHAQIIRAIETFTAAATAAFAACLVSAIGGRRQAERQRQAELRQRQTAEIEKQRHDEELKQADTTGFQAGSDYTWTLLHPDEPKPSIQLAQVINLPTQRGALREPVTRRVGS